MCFKKTRRKFRERKTWFPHRKEVREGQGGSRTLRQQCLRGTVNLGGGRGRALISKQGGTSADNVSDKNVTNMLAHLEKN